MPSAAAVGAVGVVRNDPMAMLPFCGYNMADYFDHWLNMGRRSTPDKLPRVYHVNWFRTDDNGRFLWPGFGDNIRVLKWVIERVRGEAQAAPSAIGNLPAPGAIDLSGLDLPPGTMDRLLHVDPRDWLEETERQRQFLDRFGDRLPRALWHEHEGLVRRLREMSA